MVFIRPSRDGPYYVIGYGGRTGVHTGFRTITLVLYIGSLPNLTTWLPCGRGKTLFILGSLGQRSRSPLLLIDFWQQGRFHMITLVLYYVYWIFNKLGHIIPMWKGKTPLYRLIIYIDGHILWCTHFLLLNVIQYSWYISQSCW